MSPDRLGSVLGDDELLGSVLRDREPRERSARTTSPTRFPCTRRPATAGHSPGAARRCPWRADAGQASVETVALAPVIGLVVVALAAALSAHRAGEAAGLATHAAGLAVMQGRDPEEAAREAIPDVPKDRLRVSVDGARIVVRVRAEGPRSLVSGFDAERRAVARRGEGR